MAQWITVEAERVLYVARGRDVILCDGGHPGPVTLVLKMSDEAMRTLAHAHGEQSPRGAALVDGGLKR